MTLSVCGSLCVKCSGSLPNCSVCVAECECMRGPDPMPESTAFPFFPFLSVSDYPWVSLCGFSILFWLCISPCLPLSLAALSLPHLSLSVPVTDLGAVSLGVGPAMSHVGCLPWPRAHRDGCWGPRAVPTLGLLPGAQN